MAGTSVASIRFPTMWMCSRGTCIRLRVHSYALASIFRGERASEDQLELSAVVVDSWNLLPLLPKFLRDFSGGGASF